MERTMLTALIVLAALQSAPAQPKTPAPAEPPMICNSEGYCTVPEFSIGHGMKSNSTSLPPMIVSPSQMPPLPIAVAQPPSLGPGKHELVVHWPEPKPKPGYRRTFKTGDACLKARAAILDEHRRRTSAIAVNTANHGVILAMMLEPPYAICVPLD